MLVVKKETSDHRRNPGDDGVADDGKMTSPDALACPPTFLGLTIFSLQVDDGNHTHSGQL